MTALLSRELDQFPFPDVSAGACLHQMPAHVNYNNPDRPDFYIVKLGPNHLLSRMSIGVSDYQKDNLHAAVIETFGYSPELMSTRHAVNDFVVQLVFPCTSHVLKLQLHVRIHFTSSLQCDSYRDRGAGGQDHTYMYILTMCCTSAVLCSV